MIPLIKAMGPTFGGEQALLPLWWALSLGALPRRQRHADRRFGQSGRRGARRTRGHDVPFHRIPEGRLPAHADIHRDIACVHLFSLSLTNRHTEDEHGQCHRTESRRRIRALGLPRRPAGKATRRTRRRAGDLRRQQPHPERAATASPPTATSRSPRAVRPLRARRRHRLYAR